MNKLRILFLSQSAQLIRFGTVGVLAASVHYAVVILLVQNNVFLPLTANIIAFCLAFQVSYWGHQLWTFRDSNNTYSIAMSKLLFVQILNLMANELLFYILLSFHFAYQWALLPGICLLPIFTYVVSKLWIFRSDAI
jgi:putative flippase GtrA